jgi:hypothetical protein
VRGAWCVERRRATAHDTTRHQDSEVINLTIAFAIYGVSGGTLKGAQLDRSVLHYGVALRCYTRICYCEVEAWSFR